MTIFEVILSVVLIGLLVLGATLLICVVVECDKLAKPIIFGTTLWIFFSLLSCRAFLDARELEEMKRVAYDMAARTDGCTIYVNDVLITDVSLRYCLDTGYSLTFCDSEQGIVKFEVP